MYSPVMEPPQPSFWKEEAIKLYISMGFRPEFGEQYFVYTKHAINSFMTGIGLAVLVSMFSNNDFGMAFFVYILGQEELSRRIHHELLYYITFDGSALKYLQQNTFLVEAIWPVAGYMIGVISILILQFILWILIGIARLVFLLCALIAVFNRSINQSLIGRPENPWPFLDAMMGLPWEPYIQQFCKLQDWVWNIYWDHILNLVRSIRAIYRNHCRQKVLAVRARMIKIGFEVLRGCYKMCQLFNTLVKTLFPLLAAAVISGTLTARDALKFAYTLMLIPEKNAMIYQYKPLGNNEIRLLRLSRKGLLGGINKSLIHYPLRGAPSFECISYVWGSSTKTHLILIDGYQLPVTASAYDRIRERGSIWLSRYIWIDAVCINQDDNLEKTKQVNQMRTVYKSAHKVIACLGSPPDARDAIILLHKLGLRMMNYSPLERWKPIMQSYMSHQSVPEGSPPKEWVALKRFLRNPWFERAWIVQEVTMAREICIIYGGSYLDWDMLLPIMAAFGPPDASMLRYLIARTDENHLEPLPSGLLNGLMMATFRGRYLDGHPIRLYETLRVCSGFHATDPRDKIFALQGFTEEASDTSLTIDYFLTVPEVLMNTSYYFIRTPLALKMLQFAGIGWKRDYEELPSWVADWTMVRPPHMLALSDLTSSSSAFKAANKITRRIDQDAKKSSLSMTGIRFDDITELGYPYFVTKPKYNYNSSSQSTAPVENLRALDRNLVHFFRRAEALAQQHVPDSYPCVPPQPRHEALWRTLINDRETTRPAPVESYEKYLHFKKNCFHDYYVALKGTPEEEDALTPEERRFVGDIQGKEWKNMSDKTYVDGWVASSSVSSACNDRLLAVTRRGYLALVPLLARQGDVICLIFGADVPFVLRKAPLEKSRMRFGERQCYYLVGECYVHGVMDGEGLEGVSQGEGSETGEDFTVI